MKKFVSLFEGSGRENGDYDWKTALDIWHKVFCANSCDSRGSWSRNLISPT